MTDLEMTKLCAEAMGFPLVHIAHGSMGTPYVKHTSTSITSNTEFRPLHDDAQAMALVKKFKFGISYVDYWSVYEQGNGESGHNSDLNRAIVECMAKMQSTKP